MAGKKKSESSKKNFFGWGGKRKGSGRPPELKGAITKSVVFCAESLMVIENYTKNKELGFSEAVRELLKSKSE